MNEALASPSHLSLTGPEIDVVVVKLDLTVVDVASKVNPFA